MTIDPYIALRKPAKARIDRDQLARMFRIAFGETENRPASAGVSERIERLQPPEIFINCLLS